MRTTMKTSLPVAALLALAAAGGLRAGEPPLSTPHFALENGDTNGDWQMDLSDGIYLLDFLYLGGPAPMPAACGLEGATVLNGDSNGDGAIDLSDAISLLAFLYEGGARPVSCDGGGSGGEANPNRRVVPTSASPYGHSYGEWGARWWQWVNSVPAAENPLLDETGVDCDSGQSGPVWFLAGVLNESHTVTRDRCVVPAGKSLFFPILNVNAWVPDDGSTPDEVRAVSHYIMDHATALACSVDGTALEDLFSYRADTPAFLFTVPDGGIKPAGTYGPAVADGYWLMLAPLPAGAHTIHFSGTLTFTKEADGFDFVFSLDITYHLTVAS
jgi:hypothetical protein